jgi:hypothetical protein
LIYMGSKHYAEDAWIHRKGKYEDNTLFYFKP